MAEKHALVTGHHMSWMQSCPGHNGCLHVLPLLHSAAGTVGMHVFFSGGVSTSTPDGKSVASYARSGPFGIMSSCAVPTVADSSYTRSSGLECSPCCLSSQVYLCSDSVMMANLPGEQVVPPVTFHLHLSGKRC